MKTISEIAAAYTMADTSVDYDKMTKVELIALIHTLASKVATGKTVNDLVIEMLKDETLAENSNTDIAEAIRQIMPGSQTTAKSVSSIRSVYNKNMLNQHVAQLDANLSVRDRIMKTAELEYDLQEQGILIRPRA